MFVGFCSVFNKQLLIKIATESNNGSGSGQCLLHWSGSEQFAHPFPVFQKNEQRRIFEYFIPGTRYL